MLGIVGIGRPTLLNAWCADIGKSTFLWMLGITFYFVVKIKEKLRWVLMNDWCYIDIGKLMFCLILGITGMGKPTPWWMGGYWNHIFRGDHPLIFIELITS